MKTKSIDSIDLKVGDTLIAKGAFCLGMTAGKAYKVLAVKTGVEIVGHGSCYDYRCVQIKDDLGDLEWREDIYFHTVQMEIESLAAQITAQERILADAKTAITTLSAQHNAMVASLRD